MWFLLERKFLTRNEHLCYISTESIRHKIIRNKPHDYADSFSQ